LPEGDSWILDAKVCGGSEVLTENERTLVWTKAYEADIRSLYFGDQAVRYTKHKQIITGVSLFLSSGAAAALIASAPKFIPTILAVIVAVLTAYSMAVGLDRRIVRSASCILSGIIWAQNTRAFGITGTTTGRKRI
jgi:hypothetical protein